MEIKYKKYYTRLNPNLIIEKNPDIIKLKALYIDLFKTFEMLENEDSPLIIHKWNLNIENIEFKMQKEWGFKEDKNMHTYWFKNGICTCPKLDNQDNLGTEYRIYSGDCKMHGDKIRNFLSRNKKIKRILNEEINCNKNR